MSVPETISLTLSLLLSSLTYRSFSGHISWHVPFSFLAVFRSVCFFLFRPRATKYGCFEFSSWLAELRHSIVHRVQVNPLNAVGINVHQIILQLKNMALRALRSIDTESPTATYCKQNLSHSIAIVILSVKALLCSQNCDSLLWLLHRTGLSINILIPHTKLLNFCHT